MTPLIIVLEVSDTEILLFSSFKRVLLAVFSCPGFARYEKRPCVLLTSYRSDLGSRISRRDPVQPCGSVIADDSYIWDRLIEVLSQGWTRARRPLLTPGCTAGVAAEVLAGPAVPVQLFANDLHSCEIRRKCVG